MNEILITLHSSSSPSRNRATNGRRRRKRESRERNYRERNYRVLCPISCVRVRSTDISGPTRHQPSLVLSGTATTEELGRFALEVRVSVCDGGVTLAPSQHVVERVFSMRKSEVRSEKGQSLEERPRGEEPERLRKCEPESVPNTRWNGGVVELGEVVQERLTRRSDAESGRKNGEFVPWRPGKSEPNSDRRGKLEVEKKEKCDGWGKWQVEKIGGEIDKSHYSGSERSRKAELVKCELVPENNSSYLKKVEVERRGGDGEKSEFHGSGRRQRMELEEEEFILENSCRKKDGDRGSGIDNRKRPSLSSSLNCDSKKSSRAHEEEQDEFKHEASSGKVQDKDHFFERPVKRQCGEPESNGRKYHHQEISDISQLKSRRKTEENIPSRASYPERSNRNRPRLPSKVSSSNRHPSCRHHEPVLSLLGPDKQDQRDHKDRTPSNYDRSPVERVRHDYNRDHPIHKDRTLSRSGRSTSEKVRQYDNRDHRDHRDRTPSHSDHSTTERVRHHDNRDHYDHRDRTPSLSDRSPMGRARCHDRKGHSVYMNRIPSHSHRSPMGRALHHGQRDHPDHRDHTSCPMERVRHHDHKGRSLHDRRRAVVHRNRTPNGCGEGLDSRERNKKSGEGEKQRVDRHEERPGRRVSSGWDGSKISSLRHRNNRGGDTCFDDKPSKKPVSPDSVKEFGELSSPPAPPRPLPSSLIPSQLETDNVLDELPCMEEDMDICDTPPHDTIPVDSKPGKWFYLDHFGMEQGPSKLDDLKRLINTGILLSDHLIKHSDSDRWVTVENAASPLVQLNLPSIVSDSVTELASPPEASGKSLVGTVDLSLDSSTLVLREESELHDEPAALEFSQDFLIDERVEGLLKGYNVVNGKELEILGEALNMIFEHANWENWSCSEGFTRFQSHNFEALSCRRQELRSHEGFPREAIENRPVAHLEKDFAIPNTSSSDWFSARRSCMGGDWKRNDESGQDRFSKKKIVLNHGYPLCQMPKSAYEDPRWQQRDDLYYPSRIRKLEVPAWAFSFSEEDSDINNDTGKVTILRQMKPPIPKGVKGTILPVVQTNACVVKDQGSSLSRLRFKGSERHTRRSTRSHSAYGDRCSDSEEPSNSKKTRELELQRLQRCRAALNIPRDHVCTVDELSLDLGDWYYMDGAGHVHGHSSFSEFQDVVAKGTITQNSSVFRKVDNTRLPVLAPKASSYVEERDDPPADYSSTSNDLKSASDSFHDLHPQFIGYTRGKLHELVMKSYKNREFAAAINEVLDPWISAKQQKKEMDKHVSINSSTTKREDAIHEMFRDGSQFGKNACLLSDGDSEMKEDLHLGPKNDPSFDDLCGEADFIDDNIRSSGPENENWGLLNSCILARVFHFMKTDLKSLISSAATCKSWNLAVTVYKNLCTFVDMSSVGPRCTDSMFQSAMGGYEKKKLTSIVLAGCSNITSAVLEEVLSLFPCISIIDIRGCSQFKDLVFKFQNIKWIKSSSNNKSCEESYSNIKSLKQLTEKGYSTSKAFKDFGGHVDDCDGSGDLVRNEYNLVDRKDSSSHPFRQGVYKRSKLFDARNSAAVLSRDAQMRRWLHRKSENGYKKMEQFIVFNLKDIMKENRFEFFIPEVAKIEDRMRSGYYVRRGLASLKDDISRMCRDAFKAKNRGDAKDMKHIIMSFIRLAKNLEGNPRLLAYEKDDMLKTVKDAPEYSSTPRCRKKQIKVASEKDSNRINDISYVNGGTDSFDREIKSCLSKLKRRGMNSDCETSDDHGNNFSEEDDTSEGETTASDTESSDDLRLRGEIEDVKGNGYLTVNDSSASISDNRGWGARMTKASLVPPVTRKYEVIESYLVIEDEEEVKQKMQAALPDDYPAKLFAQKSGIEESDMEIPEVKEYKPRKMLGVEVIEQEVYGIDPYTHSLLLDSMFEEPDWVLVDKHKFIEEVLLRSLNKQVRHFTGTGNSPMVYPLRPVVEEIQKKAEADGDTHILILCRSILKAMQCRRDHNYVAYRKGLGVVCNKEEGFGKDDFVVDFLGEVYPAWKWFEKQDGIKSLQKNNQDPAPEFYNIYLERPKGDRDGYDLVVVDAMHKANYASRICHSCRPNCEAKVTAVDGQYQIGIYTVRPIGYGEEVTYDYNSITESKEEYEASVCLCGSQICRGSYLNLTGEGAFEKVLKECHGVLDRHKLLLEACEANFVSEEDYVDLGRAGLGTCLLAGLPDWLVAYSAHLVRFINFERSKLPEAILKHNLEEKKKFFADINFEVEESDAEVQAEGVYNTRLQNLALTLDRVKYVMRCVFGDPKKAPPPLEKLSSETLASLLWKGEGSLVEELLQSMAPHMDPNLLSDLKSKIRAHNPSGSRELRKSLLWLRDKLRDLPCNSKCRHDAAADVIHTYAFTKCFYKVREYKSFTSPPLYISPLDLGPKYIDKMGSGFQEYCKTYGGNYCLGQLIYWHTQTNADPDCRLARARRGCLSLPDVSSFYRKSHNKVHERVYDSRTLRFMLSRMEQQPQRPWPTDGVWVFKNSPRFFGSPMLDAVLSRSSLDKEMMQWLKCRPTLYHSM